MVNDASKYVRLATEIGQLVDKKQAAYGDSFGQSQQILKVLYPHGITPMDLEWALTITRIVDKLFRIATNNDVFKEDPWQDICGYALLAAQRCREKAREYEEAQEELLAERLEQQHAQEQRAQEVEEQPAQRFRLESRDFLMGLQGLARYTAAGGPQD